MKIETKYNIGDKVWYEVDKVNNVYRKVKIIGFEIYKNAIYCIVTKDDWQWRITEDELYPTIGELSKICEMKELNLNI